MWCWWNMKLCGVNVPLAFCHCSLPLEIPSSFALGENAQTAYHMLNCIVQNSKSLSKSCHHNTPWSKISHIFLEPQLRKKYNTAMEKRDWEQSMVLVILIYSAMEKRDWDKMGLLSYPFCLTTVELFLYIPFVNGQYWIETTMMSVFIDLVKN